VPRPRLARQVARSGRSGFSWKEVLIADTGCLSGTSQSMLRTGIGIGIGLGLLPVAAAPPGEKATFLTRRVPVLRPSSASPWSGNVAAPHGRRRACHERWAPWAARRNVAWD
jgi:hypothetical protein